MKGHVRKRGSVWYATVDLPRPVGAARKQKQVRLGKGTKAEAEARLREYLRPFDDGSYEPEAEMTVAELLSAWLRDIEHRIAAKTWEGYESKVRCHLTPALGSISLKKLKPQHIVSAYAAFREKGLSSQTCTHLHRILSTALAYGVKTLRVLKQNPASSVDAPRAKQREMQPLSEDQVRLIVEAAKGTRLEVPVLTAALTGVRRGELLALKWSGIDFERGTLSVTGTVEHSRRYGVRFKPETKTKSSRRVVPMAADLAAILRLHREEQEGQRRETGVAWVENDLVFCNPDGSLWPPDTITKQFAELAATAGLAGFRLHDLRHAFASITLKNGVSVKEVSALLGHSSSVLTLSTYAHVMEGMGREAVEGLAKSLLGPAKVA
jgi:integrase